ncbi:superoxide dismutase family protein [Tamlana sp. s12]|uniref:superoxide dismutase family protein n=1 Tax=Tamlana sp. s12 TaxID=1630406 RepID=UPI0008007899|nr:superoxide dismutase family protein [Tamlana sp. s12]OBQ52019.1 superoxide dismutase [Tamlana sp. s12]QQY82945.1 superoxide dismutase family protein [Tamlana sp. s12]
MKIKKLLVIAICIIGMMSCNNKKKENNSTSDPSYSPEIENDMEHNKSATEAEVPQIKVDIASKSGSHVSGTIVFTEINNTVKMMAEFEGLKPNTVHAVHLHETSDCSAHDAKSTGGHWNPTNTKHGKWGDVQGYHRGDIGNFTADENGKATINFETDEWCISCQDTTRTINGRGIIIHEGKDDYKTQPTGDAGARIACGAVM